MLDLLTAVQKHEGTLEFGVAYKGLNTCTADELEKQIHRQLLDKFPNSKKVDGFYETLSFFLCFVAFLFKNNNATRAPEKVTGEANQQLKYTFITIVSN